jgi:hypothetical protein
MITIDPRYINFANTDGDTPVRNSETPFEFSFKLGELIDITTEEDYLGRHGMLGDLLVIQGRNIVADLFYDGEIRCRDFEDDSFIGEHPDYPVINPLFHSENLEVVGKGHYRFRTRLATKKEFRLSSLKNAIECTPKTIKEKYVSARRLPDSIASMFDPSKPYDSLEQVLYALTDFLRTHHSGNERNDNFDSYEKIFEEYLSTGKFSGDCKAASTFTAGLLNGLGLAARVMDGDIIFGRSTNSNRSGHVWPEMYVPMSGEKGFWIPVDYCFYTVKYYPKSIGVYLYSRVAVPEFLDKDITNAKLRIIYE